MEWGGRDGLGVRPLVEAETESVALHSDSSYVAHRGGEVVRRRFSDVEVGERHAHAGIPVISFVILERSCYFPTDLQLV